MNKEEWTCLRDVLVAYFKAEELHQTDSWYTATVKEIQESILSEFLVQRTLKILNLTPEKFMEMADPPDPPMY